ncbi:MAG: FAD-dependent monooxygenase [Subtercola sp.]|jgi:2-polyprenyl-6-methoxyphenol hydroxylase-like FAD-dependent oxidoreductase|nr:FAD-dependent monooxygenase [Subtercola sp.]
MTAAAVLAKAGKKTIVIERSDVPQKDWRASTFHAATLELLESIDITAAMIDEGLIVPRYQFRDRTAGLVAEFDLTLLSEETRFPYRLQLNQQRLVALLWDKLNNDPNVDLRFGAEVIGTEQHSDSVDVTIQTAAGTETLRGAYVIGADGAGSTVRKSAHIALDGFTYEERFLIVSTPWDMRDLLPGIAEVNYISDPVEWLFILRTPDAWRVLWPVVAGVSDEEAMAPDEIQRHLQSVAASETDYPIIDKQIYRIHQRVAETFRSGRILLVGDAAHLNSPVGGVGLNSGVHDVFDLTTRLLRILDEGTDEASELDTFASVRRQVAIEYVQADTLRNTNRMRETDATLRAESERELREIAADPDKARAWLRRVSLLEGVQKYGIGLPPNEILERVEATAVQAGADS